MNDQANVVCAQCGAVNRAARAKLEEGKRPDCGRCGAPLFAGKPMEIADAAAFDKHVSRDQIPFVVDFWAGWCGPCRAMAPHFAAAAARLEPHARFAKLDTEAVPDIAGRYGIRGIPTMILFADGREVARQSGAMETGAIVAWVNNALRRPSA